MASVSSTSGARGTPQEANAAEKEAADRIRRAQEFAKKTEKEIQDQSQDIRDQYVKQDQIEAVRHEDNLEKVRNKGYADIRRVRTELEKEARKTQSEGEKRVRDVDGYYKEAIDTTVQQSESKLSNHEKQSNHSLVTTEGKNKAELTTTQMEHEMRMNQLKQYQDSSAQEAAEKTESYLGKLRANYVTSYQQAQKLQQDNYNKIRDTQKQEIQKVNLTAAQALEKLKLETNEGLDAYSSRNADPFYRMIDTGAQLKESSDRFTLLAGIPRHEQDNITASIKGDQLVISGRRRNKDSVDIGPGRTRTTAAYQSYTESFPLSYPVDEKALTKRFDGDTLIIEVPKKGFSISSENLLPSQQKVPPAPLRAERPYFPENLPKTEKISKDNPPEPGARLVKLEEPPEAPQS